MFTRMDYIAHVCVLEEHFQHLPDPFCDNKYEGTVLTECVFSL